MRISLFLLAFNLTYLYLVESKLNLICHTWKMVGTKLSNGKYIPVRNDQKEILSLKNDGSYEETLYGQMRITGRWKFGADSVMLAFAVTGMNGASMPNLSLEDSKPTDSLIKLTPDSLIYASISYVGPKQEYEHDDRYFVRTAGN